MTTVLTGLRIADFSQVWAGPHCTRILGDLGAEVIKVEAIQRMDELRGSPAPIPGRSNYPQGEPGPEPWNRYGPFNSVNRNKLSLTLDLKSEHGRHLARRLAAVSDIFIENFRFGVADALGLDYGSIATANPSIIYVTMPPFGLSGPYRDYVAYGVTQEALSGMQSLTGYPDGPPMKSGINHGDPITALHTVTAIAGALVRRAKTGRGSHIEVCHLESLVSLIGEHVLEQSVNGTVAARNGNASLDWAPQGVYPCAGDDEWIAVAVQDDAAWRGFCAVLDLTAWEARAPTHTARQHHSAELDSDIRLVTVQWAKYELMHALQAVGVSAGAVLNTRDVDVDPHCARYFVEIARPGERPYRYPGLELAFKPPLEVEYSAAPSLGQHNRQILSDVLGLSRIEIDDLERMAVIGNSPM